MDQKITELCKTNALNINHLELLAIAIAIEVFGREGLLPNDNQRIIVSGDNIGARDIANKWARERSVMTLILRILHNTCQKRQVMIRIVHVATGDNIIADGLSRSLDFQTSSPDMRNRRETKPIAELDTWMKSIIKTAKSEAARRTKTDHADQHSNENENNENTHTTNDTNRVALK